MENVENIRNLKIETKIKHKNPALFDLFIFFLNITLIICDSEILLTIQGGGDQNILGQNYKTYPSQVKVNGIIKDCQNSCQLEGDKNEVSLTFNVPITSCYNMFNRLENITEIDFLNFDFSQVKDISYMLSGCKKLEKITFSSSIATSSIEKMNYAFSYFSVLASIDLSNFDFSKVIDMSCMFRDSNGLEMIKFPTTISSTSLKDMGLLFSGCKKLTSIDLSKFDTSRVTDITSMFYDCYNLEIINLGNLDFSSVQNVKNLFSGCHKLASIDLSNLDFSKVTDMSYLFYGCINLIDVKLSTKTSSVKTIRNMFQNCIKMATIDLSILDTSQVTDMSYMFSYCYFLKSINFGNMNTSSVENMNNLFYQCYNLTSMNLSKFDTTKVTKMSYMFHECINLEKIHFGNIKTPSLKDMSGLFQSCYKLTSVDLSNLNTSQVVHMSFMFNKCQNLETINFGNIRTSSLQYMQVLFQGCSKLKSIDLSTFDTSQVINMGSLFSGCINLESINFGNIKTSNVENMGSIFKNCSKLTSLNLSRFDTSKVTNFANMFEDCTNLKFLDLSGFDFSNSNSISYIFRNCSSLLYINLDSMKLNFNLTKNHIFDGISSNVKFCISDINAKIFLLGENEISICSNTCFNESNLKVDLYAKLCVESCLNNGYEYEYNNICNNKCPKGTLVNNNICKDNICNTENPTLLECMDKTPQGYYLDLNDDIYYKCHENCKFCLGPGNETYNNCIKCNNNLTFLNDNLFQTNCLEKCEFYYYFDESSKYTCTEKYECPENYSKLILNKNKCIDDCNNDNIYIFEIDNKCYSKNINDINESTPKEIDDLEDLESPDEILDFLRNKFLLGFNTSDIDNGNDFIYSREKNTYAITTPQNQKNNKNNNLTTIDFDMCENELKKEYNVTKNNSLYLLKIDYFIHNIFKVEYEVYYKLATNNFTKMNLSVCKDIIVDISIPIDIPLNEIDKHNSSSDLYNDICSTLTSESGTDIILKDRQNEFVNNNLSICEENCNFTEYNNNTKKAICSCFTKVNLPLISDIKFDKQKLLDNFKNIKNIGNFKMLNCIDLFSNQNNIFKNTSNYIMIILLALSIATIFVFIFINYNQIKKFVFQINNKNIKTNETDNIIQIKKAKKSKNKKFKKKDKDKSKKKKLKFENEHNIIENNEK